MHKHFYILLISIPLLLIISIIYYTYNPPSNTITPYSPSATMSYTHLFDDATPHHITLSLTALEWDALNQDMIDQQAIDDSLKTGIYRKASFTYQDDFETVTLPIVGIRTKGNTSRVLPQDASLKYHQAHFKIKFNATFDYDKDSDTYKQLHQQSFATLKELNLKWNNHNDYSFIRELFGYELMFKMGVPTSQTTLGTVTFIIDSKEVYFGLYTFIEPIDSSFIKKRFKTSEDIGDLYKCLWQDYGPATLELPIPKKSIGIKDTSIGYRPTYDLKTNKSTSDFSDLTQFIDQLNTLNAADFKTYMDSHFEVDRFLRYLATNFVLGMPDDYWAMGNNYYLYFDPLGKIEFIPYDYDNSLGGGWGGEPDWSYKGIATAKIFTWHNLNNSFWRSGTHHPLVDKILTIPEYKDRYVSYLDTLTDPTHALFSYPLFYQKYLETEALYIDLAPPSFDPSNQMHLSSEMDYFNLKIQSVQDQLQTYYSDNEKESTQNVD